MMMPEEEREEMEYEQNLLEELEGDAIHQIVGYLKCINENVMTLIVNQDVLFMQQKALTDKVDALGQKEDKNNEKKDDK
ncbi:MAG TPA: hypothetical protein IAA58_02730 [Candidatus Gallacutalibacter stercoravium]|nr:hypothetical protein [Candidatus Gallacutalibacter stercoravium]